MRLVTWNCNMALPRKWASLMALKPDIAIIQECATPEVLAARISGLTPDNFQWTGDNPNKGLGVFAFGGRSLQTWPVSMTGADYFLPVRVKGPLDFSLLAVWLKWRDSDRRKLQIGPANRALDRLDGFIDQGDAIVAGDFNHNPIWDKPGHLRNFQNLISRLEGYGLTSAYHACRGAMPGSEAEPTLYWRDRTADGPRYHIDYAFTPSTLPVAAQQVTVGSHADWVATGLSDHVPVILDLDDEAFGLAAQLPRRSTPPEFDL